MLDSIKEAKCQIRSSTKNDASDKIMEKPQEGNEETQGTTLVTWRSTLTKASAEWLSIIITVAEMFKEMEMDNQVKHLQPSL